MKKNMLIFFILASMIIGVIVGAIINKGYREDFVLLRESTISAHQQLSAKDQKFIEKKIDKMEKEKIRNSSRLKTILKPMMNNRGGMKNAEMPNHRKIK